MLFQGLSINVDRGEIIDLTGPSGSGKSSLLTAFAQLNPHATGDMRLDGRPARDFTMQQWRLQVAYLPQKPVLTGATVAEAIRLPWTLSVRSGRNGVADADRTPLSARIRRLWGADDRHARLLLPDETVRGMLDGLGCGDIELDRPPHDLSGGQAARVALARTLLTEPKLLLADEVDAGLDDENAARVATIMADAADRHGMAVIRIRHRAPDGIATRTLTLDHAALVETRGDVTGIATDDSRERTATE